MTNEEKTKIRQQLHEVLDIVLDGNGFESRCRNETGTLPTMFFRLSGHVGRLEVEMHTDGWQSGQSGDRSWEFSLKAENSDQYIAAMKEAVEAAYINKSETDILRRDIARQEGKLKDEKDTLRRLRSTLRRKERKEERERKTS